jgi:hypothetical protein
MQCQNHFRLGVSLAVNFFLCCTLLPFVIPPFENYSYSKLLEVLLWQSIGMVGWPFALPGLILSIPFDAKLTSVAFLLLVYPAIQFLIIRSMIAKTQLRMEIILLHIFVILSFVFMWYYVLNGYDFMVG